MRPRGNWDTIMSKEDDNTERPLPPQIRVAFGVLYHTRETTDQWDASMPARELTPLEKSLHATALRTIQLYLLGEMDFAAREPTPRVGDVTPAAVDGDDSAAAQVRSGK
jgi:hypothetical protein